MKRVIYDHIFQLVLGLCALVPMFLVFIVLHYLFVNGMPVIIAQLTHTYDAADFSGTYLLSMIVTTLMIVGLTLIFVVPFGIMAALFLNEFARHSDWAKMVRFCVEILASIPSIIYGLFGMLVFVQIAGFGMSIISGALTLSFMMLPIMMRQTEETLRQIPDSYREASSALGATPYETIIKVIMPAAMPGVLVGILLTIGRIIGESSALLFTLGSFVRMPIDSGTGLLSILESGTTLTIRAVIEFREYSRIETAAALGIIIIFVSVTLNVMTKVLTNTLSTKR